MLIINNYEQLVKLRGTNMLLQLVSLLMVVVWGWLLGYMMIRDGIRNKHWALALGGLVAVIAGFVGLVIAVTVFMCWFRT